MNMTLIIGLAIFGFFLFIIFIFGGILLVSYFKKGKSKYPFILVNRSNPNAWKEYGAKVVTDKKSKNNKLFFIKELDLHLPMRAPHFTIGGKGYRKIIHNERNEIQYLDGDFTIDNSGDMKDSLSGEEKELTLAWYDTYNARYDQPMDKAKLANILALIGFAAVLVIGMVVLGAMFLSHSAKVVEMARINLELGEELKPMIHQMSLISQQQIQISAQLLGEATNFTRQIS